jgi:4-amino-4-deoxy-L-arabinose transferase-like glycosyltransferase
LKVFKVADRVAATSFATSHYWLKLGLGLVLSLRLIYVFCIPNAIAHWRDGLSYDNIARNLISGVGYWDTTGEWPGEPPYANPSAPTARWMPGYPLFIAGVYLIFGESYRTVYAAQAVLGVVIAGFIYLLAKYTLGKRAGVLAVFLYAVDPFAINICGRFQTEQLFTLLVTAALYCFLQVREATRVQLKFALLFGLLAGAGALTRNMAGLMFGGLCLGALVGWEEGFRRMRFGTRVFLIAMASVVFLGTLAPWLIRNYKLTGQYVLSTEAWQALAMTNNDNGGAYFTPEGLAAMPPTSIEQPEIEREAVYKTFVIDWIAKHPWRFAWLYLWRVIVFWSPSVKTLMGAQAILGLAFNEILLWFAAAYIFTHRKHWRKTLPIYIVLLAFTLGYSSVAVITRYRLPLYPLLEILAAGGMLSILRSRFKTLAEVSHGT